MIDAIKEYDHPLQSKHACMLLDGGRPYGKIYFNTINTPISTSYGGSRHSEVNAMQTILSERYPFRTRKKGKGQGQEEVERPPSYTMVSPY